MTNNNIATIDPNQSPFDSIRRFDEEDNEYWIARELMKLLGYTNWRRFGADEADKGRTSVIKKAIAACRNSGSIFQEHFTHLTSRANGSGTLPEDWFLTRYACYLIAQNGDPEKPEIAAAQSYFAIKTREAEITPTLVLPQNYIEALKAHLQSEEEKLVLAEANQKLLQANQTLQIEVQILEPKADRYDIAMATEGWMTGEEIVKQLNVPNLSSTRKLYDILRAEKVLFKRPDGSNSPYAEWSKNGLAALRNGQCFDGRMRFSPVFSWKGLDRILDILRKHGITPKDKQFRFNFELSEPKQLKRA